MSVLSNLKSRRSGHEFWSVDSAPKQFSHQVPGMRAPLLLALFVAISGGLLFLFGAVPALARHFPQHDIYFFQHYRGYYTISIRIFILSFLISFAIFTDRRPAYMFGMMADMCLTYMAACAILDATSAIIYGHFGLALHVNAVAILSGIMGFGVFSLKLLERGRMPPRHPMRIDVSRNLETGTVFVAVGTTCAGFAFWVGGQEFAMVEKLRSVALLGGIGPGVFLFLPLFFLTLYTIGISRIWRAKGDRFCPPVTIFLPAHNEEHIIADVIAAVDDATARYDGPVVMLIANNNSTDKTQQVAEAALARCKHVVGTVFLEARPGKSYALNSAIAAVETDYMIRLDSDTIIAPNAIVNAMRHFKDPNVGVVGGLPIAPGGGLFDRARFLEAVVKHGFYSVAMEPINSVVGVPGMFAAYRAELPKILGGFVQGMNGEDTDMSVRIGELGYKLKVDPQIRFISEVPATYTHMREQRTRWFRSIYHISSRCRDMIFSTRPTVRGKIVLPYMLVNSGRRAMMVPLILFGLLEWLGGFHTLKPLELTAVLAVMIGAPALVAVFAALVNGEPKSILYLPEYLMFRVLRAYFTLESMLSISIKDHAERLEAPIIDWAHIRREIWNDLRFMPLRQWWAARQAVAVAAASGAPEADREQDKHHHQL